MSYLIKTWGGFYNEEYKNVHGFEPGYRWFETPEQRSEYLETLRKIECELNARCLAYNFAEGEAAQAQTVAVIVFWYSGDDYKVIYNFGYGYRKEGAEYMFLRGNYSCDCNRSHFLAEIYPEFEELDCGCEIKLESFDVVLVTNEPEREEGIVPLCDLWYQTLYKKIAAR